MIIEHIKVANLLALKDKDTTARTIYSIILNKYSLMEIEKRSKKQEMTNEDMIKIIQKTAKELTEEAANYKKAGNDKSYAEIMKQKELIEVHLPKMLTEDEIKDIINKLEDKSVPSVMKHFKQNYAGKCDMGLVNKTLRTL